MNANPSSAYRTVDALTSDPIVLTTMLFEGAVKAMRKARLRHEEQNRRGYLDEIARAQMIVGELWSTLDLDQGELPRTLSGIYGYCIHALTDATLGNVARLDEAERLIFQIGLSWRTATVNLQPNTPTSRLQGAAV